MSVLILRGKLPPLWTPHWLHDRSLDADPTGEGYGPQQGIDSSTGSSTGSGHKLDTAGGSGTGCATVLDHNAVFVWLLSNLN